MKEDKKNDLMNSSFGKNFPLQILVESLNGQKVQGEILEELMLSVGDFTTGKNSGCGKSPDVAYAKASSQLINKTLQAAYLYNQISSAGIDPFNPVAKEPKDK